MRIGVFDSGIGGLTVLREIARRFPGLDILYLGDTARVPYGTKSPETVVRYSFEAAHFLGRHGIELLVVACNTSSALALEALQKNLPIPTIGVIRPGARRAVETTRNRRIGVIGTPATIRSDAYGRAIHEASDTAHSGQDVSRPRAGPTPPSSAPVRGAAPEHQDPIRITSRACPLFVPLAEEGWIDNPVALETARIYLEPFQREGIDTLVLGCTHYPILRGAIATVMGPGVTLVDSAEPVAEEIGDRLRARVPRDGARERAGTEGDGQTPGERRFYVTDSWERFREVGARFLEAPIEGLEQVSIVGE